MQNARHLAPRFAVRGGILAQRAINLYRVLHLHVHIDRYDGLPMRFTDSRAWSCAASVGPCGMLAWSLRTYINESRVEHRLCVSNICAREKGREFHLSVVRGRKVESVICLGCACSDIVVVTVTYQADVAK